MLAPIIVIIAFMTALAGALLENSLAAAKIRLHATVGRYADVAIGNGVAAFSSGLASFVAAHGSSGPWPRATSRSGARPACAPSAAGQPCPFRYVISATITAGSADQDTDRAGNADGAQNLQAAIVDEQRISAIVTARVSAPDGSVVATRTRFLTYRVFANAPYAVVAGSRDITSVSALQSAAGGDSGGTPAAAAADGAPGAQFNDTRIHVRLTCGTVIDGVVPFVNDQQPAGNDGLPWGNAAHRAYEAPCTSSDAPVDAFHDERWNNGDANASGWTQ